MTEDEARQYMREEIARQLRDAGRVLVVPAAEVIRQDYLQRAIDKLLASTDALSDDAREAYRYLLSRDVFVTVDAISKVISGYAGGNARAKWGKAFAELLEAELVIKGGSGSNGYKPAARDWIARELAPHQAIAVEVDQVYAAIVARVAGEGVVA